MSYLILIFISTYAFLFFVRVVAIHIGLVDKPNNRKKHKGNIPLVGGISIFFPLFLLWLLIPDLLPHFSIFMVCATVLVIVGVLDDKYDISVRLRIIIQVLVSGIMIWHGLYFESLGNICGVMGISLGFFLGSIITILAVSGAINAFNMVDGIDGLLGLLSAVSISSLGIVFYLGNNLDGAFFCLSFLVMLIPYITLNLCIPFGRKYKVFMGDAGSTVIGFIVIWLLVIATQGSLAVIRPVTALWIIAIPLIDMIAVMFRRISLGRSPFRPDRKHLHHIFVRAGYTPRQTLIIIIIVSVVLAIIGILSDYYRFPEAIMFFLFIALFVFYVLSIKKIWRLLTWIRRKKRKLKIKN